jgi:hypothetical protein
MELDYANPPPRIPKPRWSQRYVRMMVAFGIAYVIVAIASSGLPKPLDSIVFNVLGFPLLDIIAENFPDPNGGAGDGIIMLFLDGAMCGVVVAAIWHLTWRIHAQWLIDVD